MTKNKKRDITFAERATQTVKDHPRASAAGAAAAAGVAAAGAFLWSRRGQIGEAFSSGMDRLSELKAERMQGKDQSIFAEEALTLKETGKKKGPKGPLSQQEIKAGMAAH